MVTSDSVVAEPVGIKLTDILASEEKI